MLDLNERYIPLGICFSLETSGELKLTAVAYQLYFENDSALYRPLLMIMRLTKSVFFSKKKGIECFEVKNLTKISRS